MVVITTQPQVFDQDKPADKISTLLTAGSVAFQDRTYKPNNTVPHIRSGTDAKGGGNTGLNYPPVGVVLSSNSERHVGRTLPTTMGIQASGVAGVAAQHELGTNIELGNLLTLEWIPGTSCGKPPQIDQAQWNAYVPKKAAAGQLKGNSVEIEFLQGRQDVLYTKQQMTAQGQGRVGQGVWKSLGIHRRSVGKIVIQTCSMPSVFKVQV